jgi:hypothetical protein
MSESASERSEGHKTPVKRGSLPCRYIPRPQSPKRAPSYTLHRDGTGSSAIIRVLREISAGPSEAMRQLQRGDLASRFITRAHKPTGAPSCTLHRDGNGARQLCTFACNSASPAAARFMRLAAVEEGWGGGVGGGKAGGGEGKGGWAGGGGGGGRGQQRRGGASARLPNKILNCSSYQERGLLFQTQHLVSETYSAAITILFSGIVPR